MLPKTYHLHMYKIADHLIHTVIDMIIIIMFFNIVIGYQYSVIIIMCNSPKRILHIVLYVQLWMVSSHVSHFDIMPFASVYCDQFIVNVVVIAIDIILILNINVNKSFISFGCHIIESVYY